VEREEACKIVKDLDRARVERMESSCKLMVEVVDYAGPSLALVKGGALQIARIHRNLHCFACLLGWLLACLVLFYRT
jgi:hypothetical protein